MKDYRRSYAARLVIRLAIIVGALAALFWFVPRAEMQGHSDDLWRQTYTSNVSGASGVTALAYAPDGRTLATASG